MNVAEPTVADVRNAILEIRRRKGMVLDASDSDTRSVGSFFMNPVVSLDDRERIRIGDRRRCSWFRERRVASENTCGVADRARRFWQGLRRRHGRDFHEASAGDRESRRCVRARRGAVSPPRSSGESPIVSGCGCGPNRCSSALRTIPVVEFLQRADH
jgi:UDP-N-acetylenolpyruvoylglucosamine reductase